MAKTKLELRMELTETDVEYLTSYFAKLPGTVIFHNMLRDMSTACGMQLCFVKPEKDLKPTGKPRCLRCQRVVDSLTLKLEEKV